ncbi:MAG: hypothetical protein OXC27_04140, partial [Caldilineaceae bacterium]|nr:hypothetical protein [Caldilineaceae bacterium]
AFVGSGHIARDAQLETVRTVDEGWFCRGALRGRSPCTREGRRPDRPEERGKRGEEWGERWWPVTGRTGELEVN